MVNRKRWLFQSSAGVSVSGMPETSPGEDDLCALLGGPSVGKAVDVHRQHRNVIAQILNPRCWVSPVLVHAPNAAMVNADLR